MRIFYNLMSRIGNGYPVNVVTHNPSLPIPVYVFQISGNLNATMVACYTQNAPIYQVNLSNYINYPVT